MLSLFVMLAAIDNQHLHLTRFCQQWCFNPVPFLFSFLNYLAGVQFVSEVVVILGFSRETEPASMYVCIKRFIDGELAYVVSPAVQTWRTSSSGKFQRQSAA